MSSPIRVTVAKDLEDLIPTFLKNRAQELTALGAALAGGEFEQLRQIGHRMKGVGNSYGFELVSLLGRQIEDAARTGDREVIAKAVADYTDYLARVKVVYE